MDRHGVAVALVIMRMIVVMLVRMSVRMLMQRLVEGLTQMIMRRIVGVLMRNVAVLMMVGHSAMLVGVTMIHVRSCGIGCRGLPHRDDCECFDVSAAAIVAHNR